MLVPFVLGAMAVVCFVFTGCREEAKAPVNLSEKVPETAVPKPALERVNDPVYRATMTNEVAVRKELLRKRIALERELEAARAAGDAAEAKSLEGRIVEVNIAIDDVRRHMMAEIRRHMTNAVPQKISK